MGAESDTDVVRKRVRPGIALRTCNGRSPTYEINYRDSDGKQRKETVGPRLKDAEVRLAQVKADMSRGARIAPKPTLTISSAAEVFLDSIDHLAPSTVSHYRASLKCHVLPAFGPKRLDALTPDEISRWTTRAMKLEYAEAHGRKKPYRAATIRHALGTLNRVYGHAARRQGFAGTSPVLALERAERPRDEEEKDMVILTPEEIERLVQSASQRYRVVLSFLAGTGCRINEALGLTWADVDLAERMVSITMQVNRKGDRVRLKTRYSRRKLDLPSALVSALAAHKLKSTDTSPTAFVFASEVGGPMDDRNVANRGLAKACEAAGLPRISPHALRHSHASALLGAGEDLAAVSRRLGHNSVAITADTYAHLLEDDERRRKRRDRLDDLYGGDLAAGA